MVFIGFLSNVRLSRSLGFNLSTILFVLCSVLLFFTQFFMCFSTGFVSKVRLSCALDEFVGRMIWQRQKKWLLLSEFEFLISFIYFMPSLCKRFILR